jgi:hypothetical protein
LIEAADARNVNISIPGIVGFEGYEKEYSHAAAVEAEEESHKRKPIVFCFPNPFASRWSGGEQFLKATLPPYFDLQMMENVSLGMGRDGIMTPADATTESANMFHYPSFEPGPVQFMKEKLDAKPVTE